MPVVNIQAGDDLIANAERMLMAAAALLAIAHQVRERVEEGEKASPEVGAEFEDELWMLIWHTSEVQAAVIGRRASLSRS